MPSLTPFSSLPTPSSAPPGARPRRWAAALLRLCGWRLELPAPKATKVLIVVYPHTSNWDFPLGLLARWASGWPVRWIGKHSLFRGPWRKLLLGWGGIPVDRNAAEGFVTTIVSEFARQPHMLLAMAPEGTRTYVAHWKSGFMRIARAAEVPLGLAYIDYRRRVVGIAAYLDLSEDSAADMARIQAAYQDVQALRPAHAGAIRLPGGADRL